VPSIGQAKGAARGAAAPAVGQADQAVGASGHQVASRPPEPARGVPDVDWDRLLVREPAHNKAHMTHNVRVLNAPMDIDGRGAWRRARHSSAR
jgi:hypothetical protein